MVEYVLNVIEDGELVDVIEGADNIRRFIADKQDKVKEGFIIYEEEDEYD
jgi:hypothetical protein